MDLSKLLLISVLLLSICRTVYLLPNNSSTKDDLLTSNLIPCEEGWMFFGQYCYKLFGTQKMEALNWQNASHKCSSLGGNLASIHSKEQQDFLAVNILLKEGRSVWIGLNDKELESNHVWDDGSQVNFNYFMPGRSIINTTNIQNDCVEMRFENHILFGAGLWYDVFCSKELPYICQKEKNETLKSPDPLICSPHEGGGWKFRNSCYNFVSEKKNWEKAEEHCKANFKGHLVTVSDFEVDWFISYKLFDFRISIWIGIMLQDQLQQKWTSGWSVAYNYLSDVFSGDFTEGRCIYEIQRPKIWVNGPCFHSYPFLCETSKDHPPVLKNSLKGWKCPETSKEWRDLGGEFCYYFDTKSRKQWHEANFECHRKGGSLASIHSKPESRILHPFIKYTQHALFIGLYKDDTGAYSWSDGTRFNFTHWAVAEPNNSTEKCGELWTSNMTWNDVSCDARKGFVCSVKKVPPQETRTGEKGDCAGVVSFKTLVGPIMFTLLLVVLIAAVIYCLCPWLDGKRKIVTNRFTSSGAREDKTHLLRERSI